MGPLVREMWEKLYINPFKSQEDEKVTQALSRARQVARFVDTITNEGKTVSEDTVRELVRSIDEDHLILSMPEKGQKVIKDNRALRGQIADEEYQCMILTNQYRVLLGKNAPRVNLKLIAAARDHSKVMKELDFFDHESPSPGKKTPFYRAARQGAKASAENIAKGYGSGELVFWGWFDTLGHHRNMVIDCVEIGVGIHDALWTELFGG